MHNDYSFDMDIFFSLFLDPLSWISEELLEYTPNLGQLKSRASCYDLVLFVFVENTIRFSLSHVEN